jgi:hypothetical protein
MASLGGGQNGKHKRHGLLFLALTDENGNLIWISAARRGAASEIITDRHDHLPDRLRVAGLGALADLGSPASTPTRTTRSTSPDHHRVRPAHARAAIVRFCACMGQVFLALTWTAAIRRAHSGVYCPGRRGRVHRGSVHPARGSPRLWYRPPTPDTEPGHRCDKTCKFPGQPPCAESAVGVLPGFKVSRVPGW